MARQWLKAFSLLEVETRDGARRSFVLELARGLPMQLWSAALNGRKRESGPEILAVESLGTGGSNSKSTAQVKPCASLHLALLTLPISCSSIVYCATTNCPPKKSASATCFSIGGFPCI